MRLEVDFSRRRQEPQGEPPPPVNHDLARATARLDALTNWERRPRNMMRVGLEPMRDLAGRLGDPHKAFRSIHVAGTKGKGSVSALIEAALVRAGLRVGRYGSPHVEHVAERVSVQGRDIDEPTLARALDRALDAYEAARAAGTPAADATWFDLLTAAAFLSSAKRDLNGRWSRWVWAGGSNSTNIVDGEIAVVTNIGLEHTEILSGTRGRRSLARKVGILKPGATLVPPLEPDDEAGRVLKARADALARRSGAPSWRRAVDRRDQPFACGGGSRRTPPQGGERTLGRAGRRGAAPPRPAPPRACPGAWSASTSKPGRGACRPHGRRACAVHSTRCSAISPARPILPARASPLSRSPPTRTRRASLASLAGEPRRSCSPICRDRPGAARRPSCRRSPPRSASPANRSRTQARPFGGASSSAKAANAWLLVTGSLYLVGALRREVAEQESEARGLL